MIDLPKIRNTVYGTRVGGGLSSERKPRQAQTSQADTEELSSDRRLRYDRRRNRSGEKRLMDRRSGTDRRRRSLIDYKV